MRRRLRPAIALIAASGLFMALASCGGGGGDGGGDASSGPPTGGSASAEATGEVTWWGWTPDTPVAQKYIAEFNKTHPNITIKYTNYENADYAPTMSSAFQTGAGPDMFDVSAGGNVGGKQLWGDYATDLAPVGEQALGADWKTKLAPGYVDHLTYDNKVVALPLGGVAAGFFWINKNLFDKNGVSTELKTYDELKAACDKFAAAGVQCFTMGTNSTDTFSTELLRTISNSIDPSYYMKALHGEASWDDPVFIQSIDIMRKMQADGIIAQDATSIKQYPESNNNFMSQKAAIVQMGTWYAQYAAKASMKGSMEGAGVSNPVPFTMMPMTSPDFAGKGNIPGLVAEADYGLAINAKAKNPEAAKVFISWLTTTKEGQQKVANAIDLVPALVGVQADWDNLGLVSPDIQIPAFKKFFDEAAASKESRNLYISAETGNAQVIAVQQALSSKSKSSADIAKQAEADSVDLPA
jgi:raffinose/stachyose/melibiose transport system substrate-binding protein